MYKIDDGILAIRIARAVIEHHIKRKDIPKFEVPEHFLEKSGVFVTLNKYPKKTLRGCIGYPEPNFPLLEALIDSAKSASTRDPRFPPVNPKELNKIIIEVSILTPPVLLKAKKPGDYVNKIKIGRDGLIIEKGMYRGLLLPQVPVEWGWDVREFLSQTCVKAGLLADCWFEKDTKIYKFSAEIFTETEPNGKVKRKKI
ncbi:TIGR00296 family protein [[Eubacterium] cellulosolvens]